VLVQAAGVLVKAEGLMAGLGAIKYCAVKVCDVEMKVATLAIAIDS
jgi:hypothetical protein